ncbi:MAG: hypothetical protein BGO31_16430 [Bacteroidetes bacterium 43-16]|nr:MAG: hypothetical protein BGO31_16430 [Bacteroidetes bacterium 43-16]
MDKLITVGTYSDYFSANTMLQVLQESGIQARLLNENSGTMLPSMAVGGIKLQVLEGDEATAREIISRLESEADDAQQSDAF